MMRVYRRANWPMIDRLFRVALWLKGLDGLLEIAAGIAIMFVPISRIEGSLREIALRELGEGEHAFIAHTILRLDRVIDPHMQLFAVIYLIGHGAVKVLLSIAVLRRYYALYPAAIGFLLLFIGYQTYRVGFNHSPVLAALTVFDVVVVYLIWVEWHKPREIAE
jgi:uncharacterized membrane protein